MKTEQIIDPDTYKNIRQNYPVKDLPVWNIKID